MKRRAATGGIALDARVIYCLLSNVVNGLETRFKVRRPTVISKRLYKRYAYRGVVMVCFGPNFARCIEAPDARAAVASKMDCA